MRLRNLFITLLFATLIFAEITPAFAGSMEKDILVLINEYRAKKRLPPLSEKSIIENKADKHSKDMASRRVGFGHSGFDNRLDYLMKSIPGSTGGAENVAYGARTAEQVVDMWINSAGHRKNILGNYNYTGIGIAKGRDGTLFYTQIFIKAK
ncbi:MAG: CAP domain-containing protein [Sphingobacteriales bacterium]|nr:MAG: CAP domain-containing protein [Sphingobacteriales bacterium]